MRHASHYLRRNRQAIAVPMQLEVDGVVLSMLSTTTVFGSPVDITLAELALEAFVPADPETAEQLRRMARSRG